MDKEALKRFGLHNGQFFATYMHKNLWWYLDGRDVAFGYGDLREEDLFRIQGLLTEGEVFLGWNEHHNTSYQQTMHPIVKITKDEISFPHREVCKKTGV